MNGRTIAAIELGSGIAGLAAAAYLTRDNESASLGMPGKGVASVVPTVFHDGKQSYPGLMMAATW
jgi:thioredoxin reductase